jgi:DNA polymerase III alpha subunit
MLRLKHHHRDVFLASLLNEHRGHGARFDLYLGTVEAEGLLLSPNINRSGRDYLPENGLIREPLSAIPELGDRAVEAILTARGGDRFENLQDLLRRVPADFVTNKDIESLVAAGAIDAGGQLGKKAAGLLDEKAQHPENKKDMTAGQFEFSFDEGAGAESADDTSTDPSGPSPLKDRNIRAGYHVVPSLAEFYPHPNGTRVELVGRVRDLQKFKASSGHETCFFVLFDSSTSVPVFVPQGRFGRPGEPPADGDRVVVRGHVRTRDRRRVCDAVEVIAEGGATSNGETTTDEPSEGDP